MDLNLSKQAKENQNNLFQGLYKMCLSPIPEELVEGQECIFLENIIDENFWEDFIEDTCNLDVSSYVSNMIESIYKLLDNLNAKPNMQDYSKKDWMKLFNYTKFDYSKPITYKTFKNIVATTPSLINFMHMQIDLAHNLLEMDASMNNSCIPINIDIMQLFGNCFYLKIEPELEYATNIQPLNLLKNLPDLSNAWCQCRELSYNYWLWFLVYVILSVDCFDTFYKMKNLTKEYVQNCEDEFWQGRIYKNEDGNTKEQKKPIAHNAYTEWDNEAWLECRNVYNASINMYQLVKFATNQIINLNTYETAYNNFNKIAVKDEAFIDAYQKLLEQLYTCNHLCLDCKYKTKKQCQNIDINKLYSIFKQFLQINFELSYEFIYEDNKCSNFQEINDLLQNTSKKEFALCNVRKKVGIVQGKTDKTILNRISEVEYELTHGTFKRVDMDKYYEDIQKLEFYDKVNFYLMQISNILTIVLKAPNENHLQGLLVNLFELDLLIKNPNQKFS